MKKNHLVVVELLVLTILSPSNLLRGAGLERIQYNHPGLVVDLGVGLWAWPLPMDWDEDGDFDLVVVCPDKPYNGVYFFENPSGEKLPVFRKAVRISPAERNAQVSFVQGVPHVTTPSKIWPEFRRSGFQLPQAIYPVSNIHPERVRANQWRYIDYDQDGRQDLVVGVGDWTDYGWDNAYDSSGRWTRGPLHGFVYLLRNRGTPAEPDYEAPQKVLADGKPVDVFGMPSPNFADFDADGDLDLLCGEFLDGFTYFSNQGSRSRPRFLAGRRLTSVTGGPLTMDLQMITPTAIDWDQDGDTDLIVGDEDGRVALIEHTGAVIEGIPQFLPPVYFRQEAGDVKFGALVTPFSFDWDGDGDEDLICGNTAGYVGFIENLGGNDPPRWAAPVYLEVEGQPLRIQAGRNGSIQGPAEAKWGYTTLSVADWDHDGLPDLILNSIWGKVVWYRNIGNRQSPRLSRARNVQVEWKVKAPKPRWNWWNPEPNALATQWRTTPFVFDLNQDGLRDLIMLDQEGYLAFFQRVVRGDKFLLLPGQRVFFNRDGSPLRLNENEAGRSGRRKFCMTDWDGDGLIDLLINGPNVAFLRSVTTSSGKWVFEDQGMLDSRILAGHTTSPTVVDWDKNSVPDLLVGAEDGFLYYLPNPRSPDEVD